MKLLTHALGIIIILLPFFASAQNTAPVVDAGPSRRVIAPATSAILTGSGSDKEGPVTFQWKQVKGPATATFATPTKSSTTVSNLQLGVYRFVLTATDNSKVSKTDTTIVSVLEKLTWTVAGLARQAVVHRPAGGTGAPPVLIAFHGHSGTDTGFAEKCFEDSWGEAVVVYPLGLRTKGTEDPDCRKRGWQRAVGEVNCVTGVVDQDLKFFDAMLPTLQSRYGANLSLVFAHGWSNGGDFLYNALWPARGSKIKALAPAGAALDSVKGTTGKSPKTLMHIVGTMDELTPYSEQEQTVQKVRTLNKCSPTGTTWATGPGGLLGTKYASSISAPVVFLKYNGPHAYPLTVRPLIVRFFKEVASGTIFNAAAPVIARVSSADATTDKSLSAK